MTATLIELDPAAIAENPDNLRGEVGDVEDLKASIAQVGIIQPLVVLTDPGETCYTLLAGARRRKAALELGLTSVPCIVPAAQSDAHKIITMLAENEHRIGLTPSERAEAYHQLTLLDWTPEQIGQVAAQPAEHVTQALALRRLPEAARKAADDGTLTLAAAAELAELGPDNDQVIEKILARGATTTWGFQHRLAEELAKQKRAQAAELVRAQLIVDGVKVIKQPKDWPWASREVAVDKVQDRDGNPVDVEEMKTKPGFAAFVQPVGDTAKPVFVCINPQEWGFTRTDHSSYVSAEQRSAKAEATRRRTELGDAVCLAAPVRQAFYQQQYTAPKAVRKSFVAVLRDAVRDPHRCLTVRAGHEPMLAALAGAGLDRVDGAGEDRLRRLLTGRWALAHEALIVDAARERLYNPDDATRAIAWLDRLVSDGYELSDAEQALHAELELTAADDDETDDTDDEDQDTDEEDEAADEDLDGHTDAVADGPDIDESDVDDEVDDI